MEVVGDELLTELKNEVGTACPQFHAKKGGHSPPYGYPYKETGEFQRGLRTEITEQPDSISLKLWSSTGKGHGKFLNEGWTARNGRKVAARPYGELILVKKNWIARIAEVARTIE
jgi:hypothetical protein